MAEAVLKNLMELLRDMTTLSELNTANLESSLNTTSEFLNVKNGSDSQWKEMVRALKEALYEIEDIVEEVLIYRMEESARSVRYFFPKLNFLLGGKSTPRFKQYVKELNSSVKKLNDIVAVMGAKVSPLGENVKRGNVSSSSPIIMSYSNLPGVIGREGDKEALINCLLKDNNDVPWFVSIVGMGGMGKTTLAQLVYNDSLIVNHFRVRMWAHVSENFDIRSIVCELLSSAAGYSRQYTDGLEWNELKTKLAKLIEGRRYLIVLDDVWNEDAQVWQELNSLLLGGLKMKGSRFLVTTRSKTVGNLMSDKPLVYELQGLSDYDSWRLFTSLAFRGDGDLQTDDFLIDIAKQVTKKCANHPLAITAVGNLLRGQLKSGWLDFKDRGFPIPTISPCDGDVMSTLKLSYDQLPSHLKQCFAYCSLFPEDRTIDKTFLINLWIAQGFVHSTSSQSPEDAAEEYFAVLLRRSFFQVGKQDYSGEVFSFKIHNLMHDLAREVAEEECVMATSSTNKLSERIRHLALLDVKNEGIINALSEKKRLRTFLSFSYPKNLNHCTINEVLLPNAKFLRVLDLCSSNISIKAFPNAVCNLKHLRFLNLSSNYDLEMLPGSITRLYNLQSLLLKECYSLKHLPSTFTNLLNLRYLDLGGCDRLTHMPSGMRKFTSLQMLPMFVVGGQSCDSAFEQLDNLKTLSNLRGSLKIRILKGLRWGWTNAREARFLRTMEKLKSICIQWNADQVEDGDNAYKLLEGFEPHSNVRSFKLKGYPGLRFPSCGSLNLVTLCLEDCTSLRYLPALGQFCHLKALRLHRLVNLEYIEDVSQGCFASSLESRELEPVTFFPSLEMLTLSGLVKLKGWWRGMGDGPAIGTGRHPVDRTNCQLQLPSLFRLSFLKIHNCTRLTLLPLCPNVEELDLHRFNVALPFVTALRRVTIDEVECLSSLPMESYQHLSSLIVHLSDAKRLSAGGKVFRSHLPSLQSLHISLCSQLRSLSGLGWMHLTALTRLTLSSLPVLDLTIMTAYEKEHGLPWKSLFNLHYLKLELLPKLLHLPDGIQQLASLQTLEIKSCHSLKALPEWIGRLIHLQVLLIEACSQLVHEANLK